MVAIRAELTMLLRIANREDTDQTQKSGLGLHCLPRPFCKATSVQNFRTSTIYLAFLSTRTQLLGHKKYVQIK